MRAHFWMLALTLGLAHGSGLAQPVPPEKLTRAEVKQILADAELAEKAFASALLGDGAEFRADVPRQTCDSYRGVTWGFHGARTRPGWTLTNATAASTLVADLASAPRYAFIRSIGAAQPMAAAVQTLLVPLEADLFRTSSGYTSAVDKVATAFSALRTDFVARMKPYQQVSDGFDAEDRAAAAKARIPIVAARKAALIKKYGVALEPSTIGFSNTGDSSFGPGRRSLLSVTCDSPHGPPDSKGRFWMDCQATGPEDARLPSVPGSVWRDEGERIALGGGTGSGPYVPSETRHVQLGTPGQTPR